MFGLNIFGWNVFSIFKHRVAGPIIPKNFILKWTVFSVEQPTSMRSLKLQNVARASFKEKIPTRYTETVRLAYTSVTQ